MNTVDRRTFDLETGKGILLRYSGKGRHEVPQLVGVGSAGAGASPTIDGCAIGRATSDQFRVSMSRTFHA